MTASNQPQCATLLADYQHLFDPQGKAILDLACGQGRNGLHLHELGLPVIFAERNHEALRSIQAEHHVAAQQCWQVDLETGSAMLSADSYQGIIVFRYLHRPLFAQIKQAVQSGGIVIYETFTTANRQFGRPNRDAFLLQPGELKAEFADWHCLHYFEGIQTNPNRAITQIVCRKP